MAKCTKFLAINLQQYWKQSGLTQGEFADKLKIGRSYLNQLLKNGNPNPDFERLEQIASVLNTTIPLLLSDPVIVFQSGHTIEVCAFRVYEEIRGRRELQLAERNEPYKP